MIVQCPQCASRYRVNDANVPVSGGKITCPSCQHNFVVYRNDPSAATPAGDSQEEETSVADRPEVDRLLEKTRANKQRSRAGGNQDHVDPTEVLAGLDGLDDVADDGTVEMQNPFRGGEPSEADEGGPTDAARREPPAGMPPEIRPDQPDQPPTGPAGGGPPRPGGSVAQSSIEGGRSPAAPDATHEGPWKLKTGFGLTYEFPDTKSLTNWLTDREELDGYQLSGGSDQFYALGKWPQLDIAAGGSGADAPRMAPSNPSGPAPPQPPSRRPAPGAPADRTGGAAANAQPPRVSGGGLDAGQTPAPPQPPSSPGPSKKKVEPNNYRPPSRDSQWSGLLWVVVVVLMLIAGALALQTFGIYDIKSRVVRWVSGPTAADHLPRAESDRRAAAQGQTGTGGDLDDEPAEPSNRQVDAEIDRLLADADRAVANNRFQTALEKLQNARLLAPKRVRVYATLADVYTELGQNQKAKKARQKANSLSAPSPSNKPGDLP